MHIGVTPEEHKFHDRARRLIANVFFRGRSAIHQRTGHRFTAGHRRIDGINLALNGTPISQQVTHKPVREALQFGCAKECWHQNSPSPGSKKSRLYLPACICCTGPMPSCVKRFSARASSPFTFDATCECFAEMLGATVTSMRVAKNLAYLVSA